MNGVPPGKRVELLLNTLRAERHMRKALLVEALDLLGAMNRTAAAEAARELLANVDTIDEPAYDAWVARVSELSCAADAGAAHAAE